MSLGNSSFFFKLSATTVLSALLFSSCDVMPWQSSPKPQEESGGAAGSLHSTLVRNPASPQESYDNQQINSMKPVILNQPDVTGKSQDAGASAAILPNKGVPSKAPADADTNWNPDSPELHGLSVGETRKTAEKLYGNPIDEYPMKDDSETLQVCEFDGFTVGFDGNDKVKFIEVFDNSVETGLNGLTVGDTEELAVKLLGKPDNHTDYVLGYNSRKTLLKLDLDPEDNSILSIKLFSFIPKA